MINPIEHTKTKELANKYKVEPYVISADIYGANNLAGSGGWTWYTGSSSWYYKIGIEYILGLKIEKGYIKIEPCIPKEWEEYQIKYRWKKSIYNIKVKNPNKKNTGVEKVIVNGKEQENKIKLDENENIEVDFSFTLSKGQAKVVHIDDDGNVTTIIECLPETSTDGFVTKTISLKSGLNRLKIVGYDCEDVELKMLFKEE